MRGHTVRRHIVTYRFIATLCVCWLAYCGAPRSNVLPLAFGMTVGEASAALGEPLLYHSGRRGSEIYVAGAPAGIPGFYPTDFGIALQFRNGRLTGWKKDWQLRHPWPF
jgi:hypothetical protein